MNKKTLIIGLALIVLIISAATVGYFYFQETKLAEGKIVPGVTIAGTDVGNLTPGEAMELLKQNEHTMLSNNIKLVQGSKYWSLPFSAMAKTNLQEVVNDAANLGRGKGIIQNFKEIRAAKNGKYNFSLNVIPDKKKVNEKLYKIKQDFDKKPIDPKVIIGSDNKPQIIAPKEGIAIDVNKTSKRILQAIKPKLASNTIEAEVYTIKPRFTSEDIKKWRMDSYISTFTTAFNPANRERTENVKIAALAIDKVVIYPGEEFSFNSIVGPRSKEKGYKESLVIQNNVFTPGLGGGVCQVSSTLYNNLLKSNMDIVQRRRHSLPVGYVSPGLDATVAYGFIDLKFKNNYDFPIIIRSSITANKLFIGLIGDKTKIPQISITTNIDKVILPKGTKTVYDKNLPKGKKVVEQPKKGYKVSVYKKIVTPEGAQTVKVSTDTYPATPQIIRIGTNTKTVWGETYAQAR